MLSEREILYAGKFVPALMASFGCHCFNLVNQENEIFHFQGRVPDLRMQVLFTAPPGFSKTLFMKQLIKPGYGILYNEAIPELSLNPPYSGPAFRFMGSCTEAGWTGSSDGSGSNTAKLIGQAEKYKNGVIGMDEFKAITQIMNQDHSGHLEQMVNMSLFEGDVEKDLKGITISYHTDITLWAGNQVMNFDISGGLFRRFLPMLWIPTLQECEALKRVIWKGDNVRMNAPRLDEFRDYVARWFNRLKQVQSVTFHKSLRDLIGDSVHYEQLVLRNFALGYTLMSDSMVPRDVVVEVTPPLRDALRNIISWRRMLLADPRGFQVVQLLLDLGGHSKYVSWNEVREKNLIFSTSFETTDQVLRTLIDQRRVEHDMRSNMVRIR